MQNETKDIYKQIQTTLMKLVPENWSKICLYASVIPNRNGEMYFYYYPKKIIKTNPINCYEIANRFGVEESTYSKWLQKLYDYIKQLNQISSPRVTNLREKSLTDIPHTVASIGETNPREVSSIATNYRVASPIATNQKWTNITIVMKNDNFTIEYHYNDLIHSKYNDEQRRIVWCYKYLETPLESMSLKNRLLVESYKDEGDIEPTVYSEPIEMEIGFQYKQKTNEEENNIIRNPFLKF